MEAAGLAAGSDPLPQVLAVCRSSLPSSCGSLPCGAISNAVIQATLLLKSKWNYNHTTVYSSWFNVAEGLLSYVKLLTLVQCKMPIPHSQRVLVLATTATYYASE